MALSGGQQLGLWFVVLASAALCTGSAAPYWMKAPLFSYGLWFMCADSACRLYGWTQVSAVSAWFYLAHASAGLSTVLSVGAAFVSLAKLCAQGEGGDVTGSGVLGLIAGLLGIATGLMFHLKPLAVMLVLTLAGEKGWAFYLFSAGSLVLAVFGLVLLALPNTKSRAVQPM